MTFARLLAITRIQLNDATEPYMLTDDLAEALFQEAESEACRRSRMLVDSDTDAVCRIALEAGTASYALDTRVLGIRGAWLASGNVLLRDAARRLDEIMPGWRTSTGSGTPARYLTDDTRGKVRVYPTPYAADTLCLRVTRLPLTAISATNDSELPGQYHTKLAQWVIFRMRSIEDSELYDLRKAEAALAQFEQEFGPARSAWNEAFEAEQPLYQDR